MLEALEYPEQKYNLQSVPSRYNLIFMVPKILKQLCAKLQDAIF